MRAPRSADVFATRAPAGAATKRPSRIGSILGASAAALVSAGLIYWFGNARDSTSGATDTAAPAPAFAAYAPAEVDAAQIVRAREQLQDVYAKEGQLGVARFRRECAGRLAADPGSLDFCISFNLFADALDKIPPYARGAEQLALMRSALPPGQSAEGRLAEIRLLAGEVSVDDVDRSRPVNVSPKPAPAAAEGAKPRAAKTQVAKPRKSPLRSNDARLRMAYQRAEAAGVNPSVLGREQRQFRRAVQGARDDRAAVARLYDRRIRTLERQARRARS